VVQEAEMKMGPVPKNRAHREMATLKGLEPSTSAVTGRRANQLRHRAIIHLFPQGAIASKKQWLRPASIR
jgi:hypothetical protein